MDAITLAVAAVAYVAAGVARQCADLTIEKAFDHIVVSVQARLGRKPRPRDYDTSVFRSANLDQDPTLTEEVDRIFAGSSVLCRARLVEQVLRGARILWVDDIPENNINEQQVLGAFGVQIEAVVTTEEALSRAQRGHYDLIISDMARHGQSNAGLQLLNRLRESRNQIPVVFYVGSVDPSGGIPAGAFGITDLPEPLFHCIFDVLERGRV